MKTSNRTTQFELDVEHRLVQALRRGLGRRRWTDPTLALAILRRLADVQAGRL